MRCVDKSFDRPIGRNLRILGYLGIMYVVFIKNFHPPDLALGSFWRPEPENTLFQLSRHYVRRE